MAEYQIADIFEDVVLNIEDFRFTLKERTHSLGAKVEPLQAKLRELPDDAEDPAYAALLIDLIDLVLEPQGDTNGTRKHAKTILTPAYKNEKIGLDRLVALSDFLNDKMENRRRPTSALGTVE